MNRENIRETINSDCYVCIVAGGKGLRLYPMSNPTREKQFCYVREGVTFIADTAMRFIDIGIDPEKIVIIVTNERQRKLAKQATLKLGVISPNIKIVDPRHGYVGAMCDGTAFIESLNPDSQPVIISTPSDQFVSSDSDEFQQAVYATYLSAREGYATLLGVIIRDLSSFMGCGHAHYGDDDVELEGLMRRKVRGFIEKPSNREEADKLMRSGTTACNTGINAWTPAVIHAAIDGYDPYDMSTDQLMDHFGDKLRVITGTFSWYDCGTFSSYYQVLNHDSNENAIIGDGDIAVKYVQRCLIYAGKFIRLRAYMAEDEMIVVEREGDRPVFLAGKLKYSQMIKKFAEDWDGCGGDILHSVFTYEAVNNTVHLNDLMGIGIVGLFGVSNRSVVMRDEGDYIDITYCGIDFPERK